MTSYRATPEALKRSPKDLRLFCEVIADRAADHDLGSNQVIRAVLRSLSAERVLEFYRLGGGAFDTAVMAEVRALRGESQAGPLFDEGKTL